MSKDNWISVNDRLPEVEKRYGYKVLCFWILQYEGDKRKYKQIGILHYKDKKFYLGFVGNVVMPVTHWQPLPSPPLQQKQ